MFSVSVNKNSVLKLITGFAAITLLTACGQEKSAGGLSAAVSGSESASATASASAESLSVHYDYVAKDELRVKAVNLGVISADETVIPAGTPLKVLGTKLDETHGTLVHLGIKTEEGSYLPADAWFLLDDQLFLGLQTKEALTASNDEAKKSE